MIKAYIVEKAKLEESILPLSSVRLDTGVSF